MGITCTTLSASVPTTDATSAPVATTTAVCPTACAKEARERQVCRHWLWWSGCARRIHCAYRCHCISRRQKQHCTNEQCNSACAASDASTGKANTSTETNAGTDTVTGAGRASVQSEGNRYHGCGPG